MANILIIGDAYRKDYMAAFSVAAKHHTIYWLHASIDTNVKPGTYNGLTILDWMDFGTLQQVFQLVNPSHLVLFHVENYLEALALLIAKQRGIRVYQADHGLLFVLKGDLSKHVLDYYVHRPWIKRIKYRTFWYASALKLEGSERKHFRKFVKARKACGDPKLLFELLGKNETNCFLPDKYIAYSSYNFNAFKTNFRLNWANLQAKYIGFPYFDQYAKLLQSRALTNKQIALIIDQPLNNYDVQNSDVVHLYNRLATALHKKNYLVYIKPHPLTNKQIVESLGPDLQLLTDNEKLLELFASISVCFGFYSTLLLPFIANPATAVFSLNEILLKDYLDSIDLFAAHQVSEAVNMADLEKLADRADAVREQQQPFKQKFVSGILYKFDGLSQQRLSEIFAQP